MITKRDLVLLATSAALAGLTMYQCGVSRNDRAIRVTAQDSLRASRNDRTVLQANLRAEAVQRLQLEAQAARWRDRAEAYSANGSRFAGMADSLRQILAATPISDTATTVPVALYRTAQQVMVLWERAFQEKDRAYTVMRDSVARNDSIIKEELIAVRDSVQEFLRREADRVAALNAGLNVGRCGWGPFGAFPCLTPKVAFGLGVAATVGTQITINILRRKDP